MEYKLIRSRRRTVSLEIKNGELVVRAPHLAPRFLIEKFVREKQAWIEKTLEKSGKAQEEEKQFADGERYLYLGEERTLEITSLGQRHRDLSTSLEMTREVEVKSDKIFVEARNEIEIKTRLRIFYKTETALLVKKYFAKYAGEFEINSPKITYKFYKSKWGSCSAKNDFSFNALLSMAPEEVIEYVVIHELVHAQIKNHSRRYWLEVGRYDPSYKTHRRWLRENHHHISL